MTPQTAIELFFLGVPLAGLGVAFVIGLWKVLRRKRSGQHRLTSQELNEREAAELRASGYLRRSGYAGGVSAPGAIWAVQVAAAPVEELAAVAVAVAAAGEADDAGPENR